MRQRQHIDQTLSPLLLWLIGIFPCSQHHLLTEREEYGLTDRRHIPDMKQELRIAWGFSQLQLNSSQKDQYEAQVAEIALFSKVVFSLHHCRQSPIIDQKK